MKVYFDKENETIINVKEITSVHPTINNCIEIQFKNGEPVDLYYRKSKDLENAIEQLHALMLAVENDSKGEK